MPDTNTNQIAPYIFGLADITWGGVKIPTLADKSTLTIAPEYIDINSYEMGGVVDKLAKSYKVTLEVVFQEETPEIISMCIPLNNGQDSAVGESLRAKAKELVIHPRKYGDDKSYDVTVFKAISTGSYERVYGLEQGQIKVTFEGLVRDNAEAGKPGNYFRIGEVPTVTPGN